MRRLGTVAIVLAGFYALVQAMVTLGGNSYVFASVSPEMPETYIYLLSVIACVALLLAFGVALVIRRHDLAARLFEDGDVEIVVDAPDLLRVALVVLGIALMIGSVSLLISAVSTWGSDAVMELQYDVDVEQSARLVWSVATTAVLGLVELAAGWALMRFAEPLAARLWSGRVTKTEPAEGVATCPTCGAPYDPDDYRDLTTARCTECGGPLVPPSA